MFRYFALSLALIAGPALAAPERPADPSLPIKESSRLGCDTWRIDVLPPTWVSGWMKAPVSFQICKEGPGFDNMRRSNEALRATTASWSATLRNCGVWLRGMTYSALCGDNRYTGYDGQSLPDRALSLFADVDGCRVWAFLADNTAGILPVCPDGRAASASWQGYVKITSAEGVPFLVGPANFASTSEPDLQGQTSRKFGPPPLSAVQDLGRFRFPIE